MILACNGMKMYLLNKYENPLPEYVLSGEKYRWIQSFRDEAVNIFILRCYLSTGHSLKTENTALSEIRPPIPLPFTSLSASILSTIHLGCLTDLFGSWPETDFNLTCLTILFNGVPVNKLVHVTTFWALQKSRYYEVNVYGAFKHISKQTREIGISISW